MISLRRLLIKKRLLGKIRCQIDATYFNNLILRILIKLRILLFDVIYKYMIEILHTCAQNTEVNLKMKGVWYSTLCLIRDSYIDNPRSMETWNFFL